MARAGKRKTKTSVKRIRRAIALQEEGGWLQRAIKQASKEVASWPAWKRSVDVYANGREDA